MRTVFVLSALSLLFGSSSDDKVTGRVFDSSSKNPISNVNIYFPKEKVGATTDLNGNFEVNYSFDFPTTIKVSHIGFKTLYRSIDKSSSPELIFALERNFINMDELVVTATRTNKLHSDVPIATEVILKSEIERSGARTVAELLSQRSGVNLQTSVEGGSVLNLLGLDSRYILILKDGQPITGKFNNRVSLDQILAQNVKKIEIVKGPSSSLYGSEAMAGVINIITYDEIQSKSFDFSARINNTENKIRYDGLANASNNFNFRMSQPYKNFNIKLNINTDEINSDKSIELIEIDRIKKQFINAVIDWRSIRNHNFSFGIDAFSQTEKGASKLMNTDTKIKRDNFLFSHKSKNFTQSLMASKYSRNYVQNRPWGQLVRDDMTSEEFMEYEGLYNRKIGNSEFNSGLEIHQATYASDRIKDGQQAVVNTSFFIQSNFDLNRELSIIVGLRNDNYNEYDSVVNPRIGLMYKFKDHWKFRSAWGKGHRAPSFMERFIDWNHVQFNYAVIGNPNLKPEISNGATIGLEYTNPEKYQMSLMFYHTRFENLINDYIVKPGTLSYQNIQSATFAGTELLCQWKISDSWDSRWGANLIDNRDDNDMPIPNTMPLSLNGKISYHSTTGFMKTTISAKWIAPYSPQEFDPSSGVFITTKNKIDDYYVVNITGSKKIYDNYNIRIGINNATNYTNNRFGPFIGRSIFLEILTKLI